MSKIVYILRSVSGAGKSAFADSVVNFYPETVVVSADDYFMVNGEYQFDASKLGVAHGQCQRKFKNAVDNGEKLIIVSNTNVDKSQYSFYQNYSENKGYRVFFLVIEKRHLSPNIHQVPLPTLQRQEGKIKKSLKLL